MADGRVWPTGRSPRIAQGIEYTPLFNSFLGSISTGNNTGREEEIAFFDAKTGLLNRRFFYLFTERLLRNKEDFSIIVIDVDLLKAYNTYFGEPRGGDIPIMALSQALDQSSASVCPSDGPFICRYDGDTFILMFSADQVSTQVPDKIMALIDEQLKETILDLGEGTSKFKVMTETDKITLKTFLHQPRITVSQQIVVGRNTIENGGIDTLLNSIFVELGRQKEAKRPPEIKELTKRLG